MICLIDYFSMPTSRGVDVKWSNQRVPAMIGVVSDKKQKHVVR